MTSFRFPHAHLLAIASILSLCACLDAAEERAAFDATIGHYTSSALEIHVRDGLGNIREASAERVSFWAQAPTLEILLTTKTRAEGPLTIELHNAMNDARITALTEDGTPIPITTLASPRPTLKIIRFTPLQNHTHTIRISTSDDQDDSPFSFAVFADVQGSIDNVQDIYDRMRQHPEIRFGLISGDLTSNGSPEQLERFRSELQTLPFPCFATLGNHELGTEQHLFQTLYGRANFHFSYRATHFTMIDSASATIAPQVYTWLDDWLSQGRSSLHYISMHIPPLDPAGNRNGAFASRSEANALIAKLGRAGVDTAVYGHVHSFYSYAHAGIPAFISGGGGAIPEKLDGIGRHFLLMRAEPQRQHFEPTLIRITPAE